MLKRNVFALETWADLNGLGRQRGRTAAESKTELEDYLVWAERVINNLIKELAADFPSLRVTMVNPGALSLDIHLSPKEDEIFARTSYEKYRIRTDLYHPMEEVA